MKKLFLFLIVTAILTACEGPVGPQGMPGYGTNWAVEFIPIKANQWVRMYNTDNPNEVYYKCVVVPKKFQEFSEDLKHTIYNDGTFFGYWLPNYDTDIETQTPLPYVLNWSDENNKICVETYYFDYTENDVAFYVAYSGSNAVNKPGDMMFRIVMNW